MSNPTSKSNGVDSQNMGSYTPATPDLKGLVNDLTLEEKVSLLAGKDFWVTNPVERLGIPSLKVSDGPNGARGGLFKGGLSSACFPAAVSLASTFDRTLVAGVGKALAEETRSKGATVLLGPTICPHRDPRGGRNFESFSEDPFLAGELATEYINGLQREGVGATVKHYAANEQETKRFTMNSNVSQRALREIYLKPFEIAVKKSDPWALMTSYNLVNGTHADMNKYLIEDVLRKEWGFKGLVMSDWGGTNSTAESLEAGLDLEMPGPTIHRTVEKVQEALKSGKLSEKALNARVEKTLELLVRTGKFAKPGIDEEQAIDKPEHRALIRGAGADGLVLLKNNNNTLPIKQEAIKSIALIGLAKEFLGHGGGSAAVNAHHKITPYQAIEEALGDKVELKYAEGARIIRNLEALGEGVTDEDGKPGFTTRLYTSDAETPTTSNHPAANFMSVERPNLVSMTMTGTYRPLTSGSHYLSMATAGNTKVFIDDEEFFKVEGPAADLMAILFGTAPEERKQHKFEVGQSYAIRIEATALADSVTDMSIFANPLICLNVGFTSQELYEADLHTQAMEVAKTSDLAIVFVGNTPVWETEGLDRETMDLPMNGSLDRLVKGCAEVNSNTIVVNSTGSPITMPWIEDVAAVVQAWFPGQEAGYAIADVLLGKVNPGGKLPVTFPKRTEDAPAYGNFPGSVATLQCEYKEDVFMGYRHYDKHPETVLFPFGYGLSYTTFDISNAQVSSTSVRPTEDFKVSARVSNTGSVAGSEVLQVYAGPAEGQSSCSVDRPKKILAGWAKVKDLAAGETKEVSVTVNVRDSLTYWDESRYKWVVPKGKYVVYISSSSADTDVVKTLEVEVSEEGVFEP